MNSPRSPERIEEQFQLSIKLGNEFFFARHIPGNEEQASKYYHQALRLKPNSGHAYWRLSLTMYGKYRYEFDPEKKKKLILKGIDYAEKAVALAPDDAMSHLMSGVNYGQYILHFGLLRSWYYIFPVRRAMETAIKLAPQNDHAHNVLGLWYTTIPWWLGGDSEKGIELLYKSVQYRPNYTTNYFHLAEELLKLDRIQEAKQVIQRMLLIDEVFDPMVAIEDHAAVKILIAQHHLNIQIPTPFQPAFGLPKTINETSNKNY